MTLPDYQLIGAIRSGCLSAFNEAVERGASLQARSWDGIPALVIAFRCGRPDYARRLIDEAGADPHNLVDRRGDRLIHRAARTGDIGLVSVLLDADVDPNVKGQCERTPLHHAAKLGFDFVVRRLIEAKANPDTEDYHRDTPLHFAARYGRMGVVRELLAGQANTTAQNHTNWTAPHEAVAAGHADVARKLLDRSRTLHTSQGFSRLVRGLLHVAELHGQDSSRDVLNEFSPQG